MMRVFVFFIFIQNSFWILWITWEYPGSCHQHIFDRSFHPQCCQYHSKRAIATKAITGLDYFVTDGSVTFVGYDNAGTTERKPLRNSQKRLYPIPHDALCGSDATTGRW